MKSLFEIITDKKLLREKSKPVENFSEVKKFSKKMIKTMKKNCGVGLASPQIGKNIRMFVMEYRKDNGITNLVVVNPNISGYSALSETFEESCLSIPQTIAKVSRRAYIHSEFYDENGSLRKMKLDGINARIFQHEYDHLDGILFIDKISK
jgi:peptide deformylase